MALNATLEDCIFEYNGFRYPKSPGVAEKVRNLPNFSAREDDVLVCSYPRSGTNWTLEIISMLRDRSTERKSLSVVDTVLCVVDANLLEALSSPRIMSTHLIPSLVPPDFFKKKCKVIQNRRNPKDIMASAYHICKKLYIDYRPSYPLDDGLMSGMYGSWFDHVKDWEEKFKTMDSGTYLVMHYEDMKQDLLGHVKKVADFLGWEISEEFCREVAEECAFQKMKEEKKKVRPEGENIIFQDGETMFLRKGEIGDWKNLLTVAENEHFDAEYQRQMKGYEYLKFAYTP